MRPRDVLPLQRKVLLVIINRWIDVERIEFTSRLEPFSCMKVMDGLEAKATLHLWGEVGAGMFGCTIPPCEEVRGCGEDSHIASPLNFFGLLDCCIFHSSPYSFHTSALAQTIVPLLTAHILGHLFQQRCQRRRTEKLNQQSLPGLTPIIKK